MCLALNARTATRDVDALFRPAAEIRKAAETVAVHAGFDVPTDWLNDAVKGFLSPRGSFRDYREMSHLRVMTAEPEYLLAMKCMSMRIGEETHDVDDTCFLLDHLFPFGPSRDRELRRGPFRGRKILSCRTDSAEDILRSRRDHRGGQGERIHAPVTLNTCGLRAVIGWACPCTRTRHSCAAAHHARVAAVLETCIQLAARFDVVIEDEVVPLGKSGTPSAFHAACGPARPPRLRAGAR